jgi:hypothetical protein
MFLRWRRRGGFSGSPLSGGVGRTGSALTATATAAPSWFGLIAV